MNELKGLLNIKNIIILFLLVISIFFCWKWITSTDDELKIKNKILEEKNEMIQMERDSILKNQKILEYKYDSLNDVVNKEYEKLDILKGDLKRSKQDLEKAKNISEFYKSKYDSIDINIKNIKKTPINRNGSNLLNSLKNKLN